MSDQPIIDLSEPRLASSWSAATGSWLPAVILLLVTIVLWEAAVRIFAISAFIIPAPSEIAKSLVAQWGTLMQATLV
ncbi:ABC transporter permease, partial [Mesorhizobium sp. M7A.F.Ca.CA.002.15.2.1]